MDFHLADYEKVYNNSNQILKIIFLMIILYGIEMKFSC